MNINPLTSNQNPAQAHNNLQKTSHQNDEASKTHQGSNENAIRPPSVHEARKILNDKIIAALDKTLTQSNQTSLFELDPADFTPDKVADRILSFIGAAFANIPAGDKSGQLERLEQARKGVEKGFNDAKEILEGLGAFKDGIAENANKTYDLIQNGLDKIAANIESGASVLDGLFSKNGLQAGQSNEAVSLERSTSSKQSFEFELTTRDGDKVTINVSQSNASHDAVSVNNSGDESTTTFSSSRLSESGYSISVQGNLDEGEMSAIDSLMKKLTDVSDKFFSGDTQGALDKVSNLGYNTSEIASFSLDLNTVQQTRETAVYQQVGGTSQNASINQLIQPLQDYASKLGEAHQQFIDSLSQQGEGRFQALLNQITDINHIFPDKNSMNQFNELNTALLDRLQS